MRRRLLLLLTGAVLIASLLVFLWPERGPKEPRYQGKSLSEWIARAVPIPRAPSMHADAEEAIRHMGTNALPCLLQWLDYQPVWWREKYRSTFMKIKRPQRIRNWLLGIKPGTRANLALQ